MSVWANLRRRFMLSCEDVNHFLIDYLEGTLNEGIRERFERHIAMCPQCSAYLSQYEATIRAVQDADTLEWTAPPDELVDLTLSFLREQLDGPSR